MNIWKHLSVVAWVTFSMRFIGSSNRVTCWSISQMDTMMTRTNSRSVNQRYYWLLAVTLYFIHEESALEHCQRTTKKGWHFFHFAPACACVSIRHIDLTRKSVSSLEQCPLGHCSSVAYSIQVRFIASVLFFTRNVETHKKSIHFLHYETDFRWCTFKPKMFAQTQHQPCCKVAHLPRTAGFTHNFSDKKKTKWYFGWCLS